MIKKHIYVLIHAISMLVAIINISLMSFDLNALVTKESLPVRLLILILIRIFVIFLFLSIYAGIFDSSIAKTINDDSRQFISSSELLTTRKESLYEVFIHWGGIFLIIGMFSFNWISYDMKLIYTQIIGMTDLHIFLLSAFLLLVQGKIFKKEILIFLVISVFFVTYSLNQGYGLSSTLQGYKDYFSVIWLFIFFKYFRFKNETIIHYIKVLKILVLIQLPIQLMQFTVLRGLEERHSGTFGYHQTGVMGIFMTGVVLYLISFKKLNFKTILLIIYLSSSLLVASSLFFFVINFFLVPIILIKKYKLRISSKFFIVIILCLVFTIFLQFNKFLKPQAESQVFNPLFYVSGEYFYRFFSINEEYLQRGGAILWTYFTVKDENKLFAGRGVAWPRSLTTKKLLEFKKLGIDYDLPMILLISGISGILIFFYLAYNLFLVRIRVTVANPELKFFILCFAMLYLIGGVYSQGWISKTTGYCFAMLIGILSNRNNKKFFIEKYLKLD